MILHHPYEEEEKMTLRAYGGMLVVISRHRGFHDKVRESKRELCKNKSSRSKNIRIQTGTI